MAIPNLWNFMRAPTFASSNRLAVEAGQQIQNSISGLGDVATGREDRISGENTERGMAQIAGLTGVDNYQERLAGVLGGFDAGTSDLTALTKFGREHQGNLQTDQTYQRGEQDRTDANTLDEMIRGKLADPDQNYTERQLQEFVRNSSQGMTPEVRANAISGLSARYAPTTAEAAGIKAADRRYELGVKKLESLYDTQGKLALEQARIAGGHDNYRQTYKDNKAKNGLPANSLYNSASLGHMFSGDNVNDANARRVLGEVASVTTGKNKMELPYTSPDGTQHLLEANNTDLETFMQLYVPKSAAGIFSWKDVPVSSGKFIEDFAKWKSMQARDIPTIDTAKKDGTIEEQIAALYKQLSG